MGIKTETITKLYDDADGEELDAGTTPVYLAYGDRSWNLYLSDKNLALLSEAIERSTKHADVIQARGQAPTTRKVSVRPKDGKTHADVRRWAQSEGLEVSEQGRMPKDLIEKFNAAN